MMDCKQGDLFGRLTFIREDLNEDGTRKSKKYRMAIVQCSCGKIFTTRISGLKNGRVKSCGCARKEALLKRITTHNMSKSSEYSSWESMKGRCLNPKNSFYHHYGGRGITICDRWLDFSNFYKDMGDKPNKHYSIDRINVDGNYEPSNCRWADREQQDRNRNNNIKIEYNGEVFILSDLAKMTGLNQQTIRKRMLKGLSAKEAIEKPYKYVKSGKYNKK